MPDEQMTPAQAPQHDEAKSLLIPAILISSIVGLVFGAVAMYIWMSVGVVEVPAIQEESISVVQESTDQSTPTLSKRVKVDAEKVLLYRNLGKFGQIM